MASVSHSPLGPPEPMLLDTCVIQNLEWVYAQGRIEAPWTDQDTERLRTRFGRALAEDLFALRNLVHAFEWRSEYLPWIVSAQSKIEFGNHQGTRKNALISGWQYWRDGSDDWAPDSFGPVAPGRLDSIRHRPSPLILRGLGVTTFEEVIEETGPLAYLPDVGDRQLVREAIFAGVPAILTTDLKTLWSHRESLGTLGLEVWRPTTLLDAYLEYWS